MKWCQAWPGHMSGYHNPYTSSTDMALSTREQCPLHSPSVLLVRKNGINWKLKYTDEAQIEIRGYFHMFVVISLHS